MARPGAADPLSRVGMAANPFLGDDFSSNWPGVVRAAHELAAREGVSLGSSNPSVAHPRKGFYKWWVTKPANRNNPTTSQHLASSRKTFGEDPKNSSRTHGCDCSWTTRARCKPSRSDHSKCWTRCCAHQT